MPYQYIIHNRIKQSKSFLKIIIKLVPTFSKSSSSSALALRILFCPFTIIQKPIGIANNLNFCPATITAPFFIADCFSRIIRALYIYIEETQFFREAHARIIFCCSSQFMSVCFFATYIFFTFFMQLQPLSDESPHTNCETEIHYFS